MRKTAYILCFFSLLLTVSATNCDKAETPTEDTELSNLKQLGEKIKALADSSVCNDTTTCQYIAFGSKPCGGPWSYLVYSTSIDTEALEKMVTEYNALEKQLNEKYGKNSDCAMVSPPQSVECQNNTCIAIYN